MKSMRLKNGVALCALATITLAPRANADIADHVAHTRVAGIDLMTYPMGANGVVTLAGSLPAGDFFASQADGNSAVATLTEMLLDKGTTRHDKFAIARELDDVGASVSFDVGPQSLGIQGRSLRQDVPRVVQILAEELREPAFPAEEFAKVKKQFEARIRAASENVGFRARERLMLAIFPGGHPNRPVALEELQAAAAKATVEDVKGFYRKHYGPAHMKLIFVGDLDNEAIAAAVGRAFAGWSGGIDDVRTAPPVQAGGGEEKVAIAGKTSVSMLLGQPTGLTYADVDSLALRVGTAVLGSGFTGRLMSTVRDKQGLTYGIGAGLGDDEYVDGTWTISATFAPALLARGVTSTRGEVEKWWKEGITAQELADRKTNMIGTYQVGLSSTGAMANTILTTLERGKPLTWLDDMPKAINALTVGQVNAAIHKYLDPAKMVLVEAGTFEPPR